MWKAITKFINWFCFNNLNEGEREIIDGLMILSWKMGKNKPLSESDIEIIELLREGVKQVEKQRLE